MLMYNKLKAMVLVAGKKNQEKQARLPHSPLENISVFYSLIAISFCSMSCHVGEDCSFRLIPWRCMHAQVSQPVCMLVVYPVVRACRHPAQHECRIIQPRPYRQTEYVTAFWAGAGECRLCRRAGRTHAQTRSPYHSPRSI
jgi:hypothetical protein